MTKDMVEVFRQYNEKCEVSNLGRVRYNGELLTEHIGEPYNYVLFENKQYRVHQLVGIMFPDICGVYKKHYHFHHLNRNQKDNRAENIVCLSPSNHRKLHQKEDGVSVGVVAYDKDMNKVGEWGSMTEAGEACGVCYRHINNIVNKRERRFTAGGYYWFKEGMTDEEIKDRIKWMKMEKNKGNRKNISR